MFNLPNLDWTTLRVHVNDSTLDSDWAAHSWSLPISAGSFRIFRIIQTGKNKYRVPNEGSSIPSLFLLLKSLKCVVDTQKKDKKIVGVMCLWFLDLNSMAHSMIDRKREW